MIKRAASLVLLSMVCSSCAVLGFGGSCKGTEIIAKFEQVGDLVPNSNVQSSDVVIGTVTDITLDKGDWQANITMCLDSGEEVPSDVAAVVRTTSLLGEKFVDLKIDEASGEPLEDGAVIDVDQTSKATELEDVFAKLAAILGTGNLEQLNRFTAAQAQILEGNTDELKTLLSELHEFTDLLAERGDQIGSGIDNLNEVAGTLLDDKGILTRFIGSFADSSGVLSNQKESLQDLLFALDRFTKITNQLLIETESGLNSQFADLRPVLETAVQNSENVKDAIQTLARFSQWWPESMPGRYLQLDVCQAQPESFGQGTACPQSDQNDDPDALRATGPSAPSGFMPSSGLELILHRPLEGAE